MASSRARRRSLNWVLCLLKDMAEAIEHRTPSHGPCDLKSMNVMLRVVDGSIEPVLIVGLAKTIGSTGSYRSASSGGAVGTVRWMSYELVDDDVKQFPRDRADMFAFGCVVFECMTGKVPWDELEPDQKVTMGLYKRKQPGSAPADAYPPLVDLITAAGRSRRSIGRRAAKLETSSSAC